MRANWREELIREDSVLGMWANWRRGFWRREFLREESLSKRSVLERRAYGEESLLEEAY